MTTSDAASDREMLAALVPAPQVSEHVADWPEDEREFHRHGEWTSFTDRREHLDRIRRYKVADAILAAGFTRTTDS
jgi:hypothetical protein